MSNEIKLSSLVKIFNFNFVNDKTESFKNVQGVYRPGLELVGYYEHMEYNKGIILGLKELNFISSLELNKQNECYDFLTGDKIPFIIVCNEQRCPSLLLNKANERNILVLSSNEETSYIFGLLNQYLAEKLAPSKKIHGTLLDIHGVGVLLVGPSAIGKSEIALELIKKGHRLVADDSVIVSAFNRKLSGRAPEPLKGFLEVRGIGIINVPQMFGVVSIRNSKKISLIISLVNFNEVKTMDRLLNNYETESILNVELPVIKLPVTQGNTTSDLVEVATMNYRMKKNGYDSTLEFAKKYDKIVDGD